MDHHGVPEARLIADTSSGCPNGKPFGWAHEEQRRQIRAELIARGMDPGDPGAHFAVVREHDRRKARELTYRQRIDLARWLGLKWVSPHPSDVKPRPVFTDEELSAIAERFAMANDEVGRTITEKALRMMPKLSADTPDNA